MLLAASHGVTLSPDVSIDHLLLQTALWMTVIVGALFGLKWLARRRQGRAFRGARAAGHGLRGRKNLGSAFTGGLEVIGRQPIGKGQWIAVVEAEGQRFLVGMSGSAFTALGELRTEATDAEDPATSLGAVLGARGLPAIRAEEADRAVGLLAPALPTGRAQKRSLVERAREATVRR